MRLHTLQTVAALAAAVGFVLAFMIAGAVVAGAAFGLLAVAALGWTAWAVARRRLSTRRDAGPPAPRRPA